MKLHCIDEITNGLQVFMPSGLVATLYKEPDKIKVIYPDGLGTITNEISYKDFEELIQDGISTLRDDLSIALSVSESLNEDELDDELEADRITKWDLLKEELLSEDFDCSSLYDSFGYMTSNSEYGADLRGTGSRHGDNIATAGCFDPYLRFDADDLRMTDSYFQDIYDNQLEWDWRYLFDETSECFYGTEFSFDWKLGADDDYGYRYYIGLIPDYSSFKLNETGVDRIIEQLKNPTNEDDESIINEWLYEDGRDIVDDISSNNFYDLNLDDDCFEFNAKFMKDLTILAQYIEAWEANYEDINYWKETIEANEWVDEEWEEEHAEQSEDEENEDVGA